jgi:hypothetical protein
MNQANVDARKAVAKSKRLERQVAELKRKVYSLRQERKETAVEKRSGCGHAFHMLLCCAFSKTVSTMLFKVCSLVMMALAIALMAASAWVLRDEISRVDPVREYATVTLAAGVVISIIALGGCCVSVCRSKKTGHVVMKNAVLLVYCILLLATFLLNVGGAFALLNYGENLELARGNDFDTSKYSWGVEKAQGLMHADISKIYGEFQCHLGTTASLDADESEYVYRLSTGSVTPSTTSVSSVQLNVSCAAVDGVWFESFITDTCVFGGSVAEYESDHTACAAPYLSHIASASDPVLAKEGTEAYCVCRASISKRLSASVNLLGWLALTLALVQLVLLVGCVRLLFDESKVPPTKAQLKEKAAALKRAREDDLDVEEEADEGTSSATSVMGKLKSKTSVKTVV